MLSLPPTLQPDICFSPPLLFLPFGFVSHVIRSMRYFTGWNRFGLLSLLSLCKPRVCWTCYLLKTVGNLNHINYRTLSTTGKINSNYNLGHKIQFYFLKTKTRKISFFINFVFIPTNFQRRVKVVKLKMQVYTSIVIAIFKFLITWCYSDFLMERPCDFLLHKKFQIYSCVTVMTVIYVRTVKVVSARM